MRITDKLPGLHGVPRPPTRVAVFHDASDEPLKAHVFLFVPTTKAQLLLTQLRMARDTHGCDRKLHFFKFSGKPETWGSTEQCAADWIALGVDALRRHGQKAFPEPVNCRLGAILFPKHIKPDLARFGGDPAERYVRWMETLIRIGLKGMLHRCYSATEPVIVSEFCTDGAPYARPLDDVRILGRLDSDCRSYVSIANNALVRPVLSDHRHGDCISPKRAHLLQLTDLFLGSIVSAATGQHPEHTKKERLSRPVRELLGKQGRGRHFRRSGHYRTFAVTSATTVDGDWRFSRLDVTDPKAVREQLRLDYRSAAAS